MSRHQHDNKEEIEILRKIEKTDKRIEEDLDELIGIIKSKQSSIKIAFGENKMIGPVKINVGQATTAQVLGLDQNGAPFTIDFVANPVTWTLDNLALDGT